LIFALCVFTSFVASITSRMSLLRALAAKREKEIRDLNKYFCKHKVTRELRDRIYRHTCLTSTCDTTIETTSVLAKLSLPLGLALRYQLFDQYLGAHPLFEQLDIRSPALVQALCQHAIAPVQLSPADCMFNSGDPATAMYFVCRGKMQYDAGESPKLVEVGEWCSEAALWTTWFHAGQLMASSLSEVISISSHKFRSVAHEFPAHIQYIREYGADFIKLLNDCVQDDDSLVGGLSDFFASHAERLLAARASAKRRPARGSCPIFDSFFARIMSLRKACTRNAV